MGFSALMLARHTMLHMQLSVHSTEWSGLMALCCLSVGHACGFHFHHACCLCFVLRPTVPCSTHLTTDIHTGEGQSLEPCQATACSGSCKHECLSLPSNPAWSYCKVIERCSSKRHVWSFLERMRQYITARDSTNTAGNVWVWHTQVAELLLWIIRT